MDNEDLIFRLKKRAEIRRQIPSRKSVAEGEPDRIADLLDEAATTIRKLKADQEKVFTLAQSVVDRWYREPAVAEGGDFIAEMYLLKEALKEAP